MTLGSTIKGLREQRRWTQGKLAAYSHVSQSHLSKIERDEYVDVSLRIVGQIAGALEVSTDYLCEEAGWLPGDYDRFELDLVEARLIEAVRAIKTPGLRLRLIEQFIWVAGVAHEADEARTDQGLRLLTERPEDKEDVDESSLDRKAAS